MIRIAALAVLLSVANTLISTNPGMTAHRTNLTAEPAERAEKPNRGAPSAAARGPQLRRASPKLASGERRRDAEAQRKTSRFSATRRLCGFVSAFSAVHSAQDGRKYCNSYKGTAPPELASEARHWINAKEALALAKLKGKVVWLEFSFLDCGGCKEMRGHMTRWHKEYAEKGLVVVDVDNALFDEKIERVKEEVQKEGVPYAVLWDADARNCKTYGLKGYPCGYLLDGEGKVVWEGPPYKHVADIEKLIQAEIGKLKKEK